MKIFRSLAVISAAALLSSVQLSMCKLNAAAKTAAKAVAKAGRVVEAARERRIPASALQVMALASRLPHSQRNKSVFSPMASADSSRPIP